MKRLLLFLGVTIFSLTKVSAQSDITGIVTGDDKKPLENVTVAIVGNKTGTTTNSAGAFTIKVAKGIKLQFSLVGYETVTLTATDNMQITLDQKKNYLDETVVIGYGQRKRKDLTSSISTLSGEILNKAPVAGLDQALQGRVSGVQVTANNGQPGSGISVRVRGINSINGSNEPLYVIDGFPITNTQTGIQAGGEDKINGLAGLNPADIESIDILKDASAQAIYGARAANGVVLITTKKGKIGAPKVSYNAFFGAAKFNNYYKLLDAQQFKAYVNDLDATDPIIGGFISPILLNDASINTNWQDEVFQTGLSTSNTLSVSGGNTGTRYYLSLNYFKQDGIVVNSAFERASLRFNIDQNISSKIKMGAGVAVANGTNDRSRNFGTSDPTQSFNNNNRYGGNVLASALVANPYYNPRNADGRFAIDTFGRATNQTIATGAAFVGNPLAMATQRDLKAKSLRLITTMYADVQLHKNLKYRFNAGYDYRTEDEAFNLSIPDNNSFTPQNAGGRILAGLYTENYLNTENTVNYNTTVSNGNLAIDALIGQNFQKGTFTRIEAQSDNVPINGVQVLTAGIVSRVDNNKETYVFASWFGRLNLTWKDKYAIQASIRRDGSSRFGTNKKYGNFPSVSGFWRISKEKFLSKTKWLNDLKIRASYGIVGNAEIGNNEWQAAVASGSNYSVNAVGVAPINPVNLDYSWESNRQLDLGLDLSILNNRVTFTFDYFKKQNKDLLLNIPIPSTTGFQSVLGNIGTFENNGFEFGLNTVNLKTKNFSWSSNFNITFLKNKVISLATGISSIETGPFGNGITALPGKPIFFNVLTRKDTVNSLTGQIVYNDINGDNVISALDRVDGGSPFPNHFGGFTNTFTYKNFDVSIFLQWSSGNKIYNTTRSFVEKMDRGYNQNPDIVARRWKKPGDVTDVPRANWGGGANANYLNFASQQFLEDGSYLRLKNVQLGYEFGALKLANGLNISSLRAFITAQNLFTFTKYKGFDPEVSAASSGLGRSISVGEDNATYPQAKTFVFGVNVTF
jgi:TonB-dependent starch-binding outer membrane protein SusC